MKYDTTELVLALVGGILLSLSTSLNLLLKGRITGMSGQLSGIIQSHGTQWKMSLLSGMGITSCITWLIFGFDVVSQPNKTQLFASPETVISQLNLFGFALSGVLVGLGTRLSNGCTSGHGICGLPRFSLRSITAVFVFMLSGIAIATFRYHVPFMTATDGLNAITKINYHTVVPILLAAIVVSFAGYVFYLKRKLGSVDYTDLLVSFCTGVLFALGLIISGMIKRDKVLGFLIMNENWDPSLLIVMCGAVIPNFFTFHYILKREQPIFASHFDISPHTEIDYKVYCGAALFGLGWGIAGICPGPSYVMAPIFIPHITVIYILSLLTGFYLSTKLMEALDQKNIPAPKENYLYSSNLQQKGG